MRMACWCMAALVLALAATATATSSSPVSTLIQKDFPVQAGVYQGGQTADDQQLVKPRMVKTLPSHGTSPSEQRAKPPRQHTPLFTSHKLDMNNADHVVYRPTPVVSHQKPAAPVKAVTKARVHVAATAKAKATTKTPLPAAPKVTAHHHRLKQQKAQSHLEQAKAEVQKAEAAKAKAATKAKAQAAIKATAATKAKAAIKATAATKAKAAIKVTAAAAKVAKATASTKTATKTTRAKAADIPQHYISASSNDAPTMRAPATVVAVAAFLTMMTIRPCGLLVDLQLCVALHLYTMSAPPSYNQAMGRFDGGKQAQAEPLAQPMMTGQEPAPFVVRNVSQLDTLAGRPPAVNPGQMMMVNGGQQMMMNNGGQQMMMNHGQMMMNGQPMSPGPGSGFDLSTVRGLLVVQEAQYGEALAQSCGICYEQPNRYAVGLLPPQLGAARNHNDPNLWNPLHSELTSQANFGIVNEVSDGCGRCCWTCMGQGHKRSLTLDMAFRGPAGNVAAMRIDRPWACGGWCCCGLCCLFSSTVQSPSGVMLGSTEENCDGCSKKCEGDLCCTYYTKIRNAHNEVIYQIRTNECCFGRVNNVCGATCCRPNYIQDILQGPIATYEPVTTIQKTYGVGGGCEALCRSQYNFSNYIIEFPPQATHDERLLILAGLFHVEYQVHEFKKQNNNNNTDMTC